LYNFTLSWAIFGHVREDIFEKHTLKIWLVFSNITPVLIGFEHYWAHEASKEQE